MCQLMYSSLGEPYNFLGWLRLLNFCNGLLWMFIIVDNEPLRADVEGIDY